MVSGGVSGQGIGSPAGRLSILPIVFAAQRSRALRCEFSFVVSEIMAMEHVRDHVYGIQWHPEAVEHDAASDVIMILG